jgi:flagellar motor component MotA
MRTKNLRLIIVGSAMILIACVFFIGMGTMAGKSNDPATLMQTVGTVSGVFGGLGAVMAAFGLIGRRAA